MACLMHRTMNLISTIPRGMHWHRGAPFPRVAAGARGRTLKIALLHLSRNMTLGQISSLTRTISCRNLLLV